MIPRVAPFLGPEELLAAVRATEDALPLFERDLAAWCGVADAVLYPSGRAALRALLAGLELEGHELLLPAYTCAAVPRAVVAAGATPRLLDVRPDDFQIDVDLIRKFRTKNTRAILPTFLFGLPPADPRGLLESCDGLEIITDLALAPGLIVDGRPAGQFGRAGILSFNHGKVMTALRGGAVVTNDRELAHRLRTRRNQLLTRPSFLRRLFWWGYFVAGYVFLRPGMYRLVDWLERSTRLLTPIDPNARHLTVEDGIAMSPMQAAIGRTQLDRAKPLLAAQRRHARIYFERLDGRAGLPPDRPGAVWTHFPVRFEDASRARRLFRRASIAVGAPWNYALSSCSAWHDNTAAPCPEAERAAREVVCLPTLGALNETAIERTADVARGMIG